MSRISRDQMFMEIANVVAKRGTCDRAQVGAVIAYKGRIISIGYNGSKPGEPHCDDVGHLVEDGHCIRTTHAEVNAIDFANQILFNGGCETREVDLYVTHLPCEECCKYIASNNSGLMDIRISHVYFDRRYPEYLTDEEFRNRSTILHNGGVEGIVQFKL